MLIFNKVHIIKFKYLSQDHLLFYSVSMKNIALMIFVLQKVKLYNSNKLFMKLIQLRLMLIIKDAKKFYTRINRNFSTFLFNLEVKLIIILV